MRNLDIGAAGQREMHAQRRAIAFFNEALGYASLGNRPNNCNRATPAGSLTKPCRALNG